MFAYHRWYLVAFVIGNFEDIFDSPLTRVSLNHSADHKQLQTFESPSNLREQIGLVRSCDCDYSALGICFIVKGYVEWEIAQVGRRSLGT